MKATSEQVSFICRYFLLELLFFIPVFLPLFAVGSELATVKIGVLAKRGSENAVQKWTPTAEYLSRAIPARSFEIVPLDFTQVRQAVKDRTIDFLITNSGYYVALEYEFGVSRIATMKNLFNHVPKTLFGGVIFTRPDRTDINGLRDLTGKSFCAVDQESLGGWLMALREFHAQGINPGRDFKALRFAGTHDAVVSAVLSGKADAGTVRTDILEKMAEEGGINLASLKILNPQSTQDNFPYLHSTRLYPEWPFAKLNHTAEKLSEDVAIALLSMSPQSMAAQAPHIGGWTVPLDYQPVHELFQELELGPYAHPSGKIHLIDFVKQYWIWLLIIAILFVFLLIFTSHTVRLNRKLVSAEAELNQYSLRLEQFVEERTAELRKSESSLAEAQRIAHLGNWEWLIPENEVRWSVEAYRIYGFEPGKSSPSYESFIAAVHPDDREMVSSAVVDALEKRGAYSVEHRLVLPDKIERHVHEQGEVFWAADGKPAKMVGIVQDITERKILEQERTRLVKAVEYAAESIIITDQNGTIEYVNPAFTKVTGYSREEVVGQNPCILQGGQHDQLFYGKMWDTLRRGESWSGHFINRKKDGALFEEDAAISPILDGAGNIINYVAVKHDVTERVLLEKQLLQAQKLESIGTLAGGIAHDFNNILTAILGYGEMVMLGLPEDSPLREQQNHVVMAGRRASDLVKQILTFSRRGEQERRPLQVQQIVTEVLKLLRATIPATIEFKLNIDEGCGAIFADPTQIHQVVMNLCTNAYHAMREKNGGVLGVGLTSVELGPETMQNKIDLRPGPYVRLEVSDTGQGMSKPVLERIFEPYFTTKAPGEGTGLGLAVAHGLAKSMGGDLTVYSEIGTGTTFHVYFPQMDSLVSQETLPVQLVQGGNERLLVVDDEEAIVQLEQKLLESLGYQVTATTKSVEAWQVFKAHPDSFDLIITDMTMPHMSGNELATEIMKLRQDMPVILCTGFSETINEEKAKANGIREYLMKPISKNDLATAIRRVLNT
ncbi:MAG: PhnD/SsuA/transferrin family substrate-binding protein [Desulfobulbia bacterium]